MNNLPEVLTISQTGEWKGMKFLAYGWEAKTDEGIVWFRHATLLVVGEGHARGGTRMIDFAVMTIKRINDAL